MKCLSSSFPSAGDRHPSDGRGGREGTRLTRQAATAAAVAIITFGALVVVSPQIQAVRAHSHGGGFLRCGGVLNLVVSAGCGGGNLRTLLARSGTDADTCGLEVLRETGATFGAIVATDIAVLPTGARVKTWGSWFGSLVGLLALIEALGAGAVVVLALAWSRSRRYMSDSARSSA